MWRGGGPCSDLFVRFSFALLVGFIALASRPPARTSRSHRRPFPSSSGRRCAGSSGPTAAGPASSASRTSTCAAYFDAVCQSGDCTSTTSFEEVVTQAAFDARIAQLAEAIALIDPDVITLEEVETEGCLDALAAKLA